MKRLLSFLLLLLLLQPLLVTLLAAGGDPDAGLPACCRRNGAHHCAMRMQMLAAEERSAAARTARAPFQPCPLFPHALAAQQHHDPTAPGRSLSFAGPLRPSAPAPEAECLARLALARCRGDRGPPLTRA